MSIHGVLASKIPTISSPSSFNTRPSTSPNRTTVPSSQQLKRRRTMPGLEARISLVLALASQTSSVSRRFLEDLANETSKYVFPKRFESRTLEEALMSVPDLETVNFRVLSRTDQYEIREVERRRQCLEGRGFNFNGGSQSFNVLAEYLFGKNMPREKMEMTTPVITRKAQPNGEKMEMTTPVITKKDLANETSKYVFPKRFESRTLEGALMSVPDLETVNFRVLSRTDQYEIREVERRRQCLEGRGFDFNGGSQSFNVLAEYLFGKNMPREKMEMTTPVITRKAQPNGEKMEMTTPGDYKEDQDKWQMSFDMPSKYGSDLPLPKDSSVRIREVPRKTVAVVALSGFVTDEEVKRWESKLRETLKNDRRFRVKDGASVEVAQYNPPFTLPFQRRNEIALEVQSRDD